MSELFEKSIRTLELPRVLELLREQAISPEAKERALRLRPETEREEVERLLDTIGAPKSLGDMGVDDKLLPMIFQATKDIRDKYVLSRLAWDLGLEDELFGKEN